MLQELPITDKPTGTPESARPLKAWLIHSCRVAICLSILVLIGEQAKRRHAVERLAAESVDLPLNTVQGVFPAATDWGTVDTDLGARFIVDANGTELGYVMQTSPKSDDIIGFSGPTNVLLIFDNEHVLRRAEILWSRDTKEHLQQIRDDPTFLGQFSEISRERATQLYQVESVSGATLTSLAIVQSIVQRLGGEVPNLKFPEPLTMNDADLFFESPAQLVQDQQHRALWHVYNSKKIPLGSILRTSPAADNIVGYQGPTETLIGRDPQGLVFRILVRNSYENAPYYEYLNEDWAFPDLFTGLTLAEVAEFDPVANGVEGVSGATMTSLAVADSVVLAAQDYQREQQQPRPQVTVSLSVVSWRDIGTSAMVLLGLVLAFTRLRGYPRLRMGYQLLLIVYVGFINGDLLSQAMLVGWAQNGIPWNTALSLIVVSGVALIFPVATKRNVYCSQLCPHGAIQQLVKNRVRKPMKLSKSTRRYLRLIPAALLLWVVVVAMLGLSFSLVDIEPFDAYLFQIAGWATIAVFVSGITASLFVPMAYCKYGCPTGGLLEYLRRHRRSDKLTATDAFAVTLLGLAVGLYLAG